MSTFSGLNPVDIAALALIGIGCIQGYFRGLSGELARLIGTVIAFMAGVSLNEPVGEWILENTRLEDQAAHAVAFIATVFLCIVIMLILRVVIKKMIKVVFAERFDKTVGIFAGMLRMVVVVCIIFICMNLIPHEYLNLHFGEESVIGRVVVQYVPSIRDTLERAIISIPENSEDDASQPEE
jgi:uncharacterized membrane protein required for colicin V production